VTPPPPLTPIQLPNASGRTRWRTKASEWIRRYGWAEVFGSAGAVSGALLVRALGGSEILAAYAGTVGENIGYYGVMISRDVSADARVARLSNERYGARGALRTARNLVLEFGGAELLDSGLIRPLAMGIGARYFGATAGVLVGKVVADLVFYVPVIATYELRRFYARRSG